MSMKMQLERRKERFCVRVISSWRQPFSYFQKFARIPGLAMRGQVDYASIIIAQNVYFRLRFGLVNTFNSTYLRLKIVLLGEVFSFICAFIEFAIPDLFVYKES